VQKKECHSGNIKVCEFKYNNKTIIVYAGGISRGFDPTKCDVVISAIDPDVPMTTFGEKLFEEYHSVEYIYLPIEDFRAPVYTLEDYKKILDAITRNISKEKISLGVYCFGGHGRTGTILAVILYHFAGIDDPVGYIRENYCKNAIEIGRTA